MLLGLAIASLAAALVPSDQPARASTGRGVGYIAESFAHLNGSTIDIVGTSTRFVFEELSIARGWHSFVIRHDLDLSTGGTGVLVAGVANRQFMPASPATTHPKCGSGLRNVGSTPMMAFVWYDFGAHGSHGEIGATGNLLRSRFPQAQEHRLSLRYTAACLHCNYQGQYALRAWEHVYSGALSGRKRIEFPSGVYPVRVRETRHGLDSREDSADNDIHIGLDANMYYVLTCDLHHFDCFVPAWPSRYVHPWQQLSHDVSPGSGIEIYDQGGHDKDLCAGRCPDTPCGCSECLAPAVSPNYRWLPEHELPLVYKVYYGTFGSTQGQDEWAEAIDSAASVINETFSVPGAPDARILANVSGDGCPYNTTVDIEVKGVLRGWDQWGGPMQVASTFPNYRAPSAGPSGVPTPYVMTECGPGVPPSRYFKMNTPVTIRINLSGSNSTDYVSDLVMTSPDWGGAKESLPMELVAVHEFMHALGLDCSDACPDGPDGSPPAPPQMTPTPVGAPAVSFPVTCDPQAHRTTGYHARNVLADISAGDQSAIRCLTFR